MIAKTDILQNLNQINSQYNHAKSQKEALFLSKLAVLEFCGWIEESMDDIIIRASIRLIKDRKNRAYISKEVVKPTYGFEYTKHFRSMLIRLLGIVTVERIERSINDTKFTKLVTVLNNLKIIRDTEAHTHTKGKTHTVHAPSVTLGYFKDVYDGLVEIDTFLRKKL